MDGPLYGVAGAPDGAVGHADRWLTGLIRRLGRQPTGDDLDAALRRGQRRWLPWSRRPEVTGAALAVLEPGRLTIGQLGSAFAYRVRDGILVPLTLVAALYAPLVFLGGFWPGLVGVSLWGLGMGVHESIIPAAVAPMVPPDRRASAYGLFTAAYGIAWFVGSAIIGALFGVSLGVVVAFAVVTQVAAIPLIVVVRRRTSAMS
jgi:hypothetical protein